MIGTIIGIIGAIRSGKSHSQLKYGLKYANDREKKIVCNFLVNIDEIYKYACLPNFIERPWGGIQLELSNFKEILHNQLPVNIRKAIKLIVIVLIPLLLIFNQFIPPIILLILLLTPRKSKIKPLLPWIKKLCEDESLEGFVQIPNPENLQTIMIPESVALLDEAGILLNSRAFAKTPKELLADLAQSGKFGTDLIWCAQFDEQIDRQMRMLTQFFWYCEGATLWDKVTKRPRLVHKTIYMFNAKTYDEWSKSPKAKNNEIKTRFAYALETHSGMINKADLQIFNCFESFTRLDLGRNRIQAKINKTVVSMEKIVSINPNLIKEEESEDVSTPEPDKEIKIIYKPLNLKEESLN